MLFPPVLSTSIPPPGRAPVASQATYLEVG